MAALRCAGAGRALLRRSPGLLRRAAGDEQGVLVQPIGAVLPSSNRYISNFVEELDKKRLATALMTERSAGNEIQNLDELLDLLNDNNNASTRAARDAIVDKKLELVSLLLRGDDGQEWKKKMEELAVAARRHRESLIQEDMKRTFKLLEEHRVKMIIRVWLWGIPLTFLVLSRLH